MGQSRQHKECVEESHNKLAGTHNCRRESPIYRNGWRFLDSECHPINPKPDPFTKINPVAVECECGSSELQRESNRNDLIEWKRQHPDGVPLQIEDPTEIDNNMHRIIEKRSPFFPKPIKKLERRNFWK